MINSIGSNNGMHSLMAMQQRMEAMLKTADQDGDGKLNKSEFSDFIAGMSTETGNAQNVDTFFSQADTDGDSLLSLEELKSARPAPPPPPMMQQGAPEGPPPEMQQMIETGFSTADADGDGFLNESEFSDFIAGMAENTGLTPNAEEMFAAADGDGDLLVSLEDIMSLRPPKPPMGGGGMMIGGGGGTTLADILSEEDTTESLMSYLDSNGDGTVDIEEIRANYQAVRAYLTLLNSESDDGTQLDITG